MEGSMLNIRSKLARLEIVLHCLADSHWLNLLLCERASLAIALADSAIWDCRSVCNAILARQQSDVHSPRPHRWTRAGVELLWMLDSTWLSSNPPLKDLHPPLKLDVVIFLLSSQLIDVDNEHDGPVALTGWTVEVGDLKE